MVRRLVAVVGIAVLPFAAPFARPGHRRAWRQPCLRRQGIWPAIREV